MANITRGQVWDVVVKQATENPKYRAALLKDPRALMSQQLGSQIPSSVNVKVLEEDANTYYVILPHAPKTGAELADSDLEKVAGGGTKIKGDAKCGGGMMNTVNEIRLV
jgi:hypothetical protein